MPEPAEPCAPISSNSTELVIFDVKYESSNGERGSDDNLLSNAHEIKLTFPQGKGQRLNLPRILRHLSPVPATRSGHSERAPADRTHPVTQTLTVRFNTGRQANGTDNILKPLQDVEESKTTARDVADEGFAYTGSRTVAAQAKCLLVKIAHEHRPRFHTC